MKTAAHVHKLRELGGTHHYRYDCVSCGKYFQVKPKGSVMAAAQKKTAKNITDRAKRYRANRNPPPGPRRCNFCSSRKNVDVDHIDGNEANDEPENKMFLCRPCNVAKAIVQVRNRIGIRTNQYNPQRVPTFSQFQRHARVLLGMETGDAAQSTAAILATPPKTRAKYAEWMQKNPALPTYAQYARAVSIHQREAHDEGGAIIHATPPALRHRYAMKIAATKKKRGS